MKTYPNSQTTSTSAPIACAKGHTFSADLITAINTATDPEAMGKLEENGTQVVSCPSCGVRWQLAMPVIIHNPPREQVTLLIPLPIAHMVNEAKGSFFSGLAEKQGSLPSYFGECGVALGRASIPEWESEMTPATQDGREIHAAFADLGSIIPEPPETSTSDE